MKPVVRSHLLFFGGAVLVLLLDQLSKLWVVQHLPAYTPVDLIPQLAPLFSFTFVKNTGVAFGLFPKLGGVFTMISSVVIVGILLSRRVIAGMGLWVNAALGLVTGGALGNLLDRLTRGYVVDFLDVNFWPLHEWPVFNLADSAIVVGVGILLLDSFVFGQKTAVPDAGA
ncbi:MAG TPA: signal peptidase II [Anaerolineae bacterium]|mgnify:CR=1 FL=1|nr:signal peptidase II [Anaerolineae bacterium]HQK12871.1 signal peptidase II [Anaerolineae bacterium]